jgi:hypothetical protein
LIEITRIRTNKREVFVHNGVVVAMEEKPPLDLGIVLVRKLMLGKMQRSEYTQGRNQEITKLGGGEP